MLKIGDQWEYHNVIYTVARSKLTRELYFKHPDSKARWDDHIAIEHVDHGKIVKETTT